MVYVWKSQTLISLTISVFAVSFHWGVYSLKIKSLTAPAFVRNGTEEFVILDCDYEYEKGKDDRLVVKWFHNNDTTPLYQWIPKEKSIWSTRQFGDDRISNSYEVSSGDEYTEHRALHISWPTTEFSGCYTCQVQSHNGGDAKKFHMTVYAPPSFMSINYTVTDDMISITCIVDGVSPMPNITMFQIDPGEIDSSPIYEVDMDKSEGKNIFDIVLVANVLDEPLEGEGLRYFGCSVSIPGTNYTESIRVPYLPAPKEEKFSGDSDNDAVLRIRPFVLTIVTLVSVHLFRWW